MIIQLSINIFPNFGMFYMTTRRVSVRNLKSFGPTKSELRAIYEEFGEFSIMLIWDQMSWWAGGLSTNMATAI